MASYATVRCRAEVDPLLAPLVAAIAVDLEMITAQRERRLQVVVEYLALPRARLMARAALSDRLVLEVFLVAGGAGLRRGTEDEALVARQTGRRLVRAGERAGALAVIERRVAEARDGVAGAAVAV